MPYNPALDRTLQPPPGPRRGDPLPEIDAALALFDSTFNRKKKDGSPDWVLEDISELSTNYLHLIERYGEPGSAFRRSAEAAERDEPDRRSRMLLLHGILVSLRRQLAGDDADRAESTSTRPND
jgi:hypothetical protein